MWLKNSLKAVRRRREEEEEEEGEEKCEENGPIFGSIYLAHY